MRNMFIAFMLIASPMLLQAAPEYQDEVHYQAVTPEQPGADGKQVKVMEFFWYGCVHCYAFEPHLKKWLEQKPENVDFEQVPAMFNRPDVVLHAKTYYALNLIGAKPEIHAKIFHAMHEEKRRMRTAEEMEEFLEGNGVDMEKFRKAMKSFAVQTSARKAAVLAENYNLRGVPSLAVDGKYKIGGLEGGEMINIMKHLVGEVSKSKAATD